VLRRRSLRLGALVLVAVLVSLLAVTNQRADASNASGHDHGASDHHVGHAAALRTSSQVAFHDQMRKLWEDHVTWTRLAIVTFADGS
jgi:hypothetical protein